MSERFSGGFITKTPVTPTSTSASGIWTLDQQEQAQKAGNWPFGGPFNYIEDVFSTYLYTGSGSTQTITNGIDLASRGGLVWIKNRGSAVDHNLMDTSRGPKNVLSSNNNLAQSTDLNGYNFNSFLSNGFSLDPDNGANRFNTSGNTYASWSFREQAKFFDVVTYTGNGSYTQSIPHNLGSAPGFVICKKYGAAGDWCVWHRGSGGNTDVTEFSLNSTNAAARNPAGYSSFFTSTTFDPYWVIGASGGNGNESGQTYVAYLFAHNAGGFGPTATDNVISCGSYTGTGAVGNKITLGYEPQWLLIKRTDTANSWYLFDTMRGLSLTQSLALLPNGTNSDLNYGASFQLNADGVTQNNANSAFNASGGTYIYIAIRRGPMKVPTSGTSVFAMDANKNNSIATSNFPVDSILFKRTTGSSGSLVSRLTRAGLSPDSTSAEISSGTAVKFDSNTGVGLAGWYSDPCNYWMLRRAPSFFDEVCYTGTGVARTVTHNLTVAPELIIVKARNLAQDWYVYNGAKPTFYLTLNSINSESNSFDIWGGTATATNFYVNNIGSTVNDSGYNFVAYLFATCLGVSKVGSYIGTGTLTTINCGFTGGARYVLIKRTDTSGGWFVWDTARGMVSGTDPSLRLNSTAAEVNANSIYTTATGFQLLASPAADVNTNGGSYIYLAIA